MGVVPQAVSDPRVLVVIHGRAFSGAYFGHAVKIARDNGIRVIVPELFCRDLVSFIAGEEVLDGVDPDTF